MNFDELNDYFPPRPEPSSEELLLESIHEQSKWVSFLDEVLYSEIITPSLKSAFHTKWIESGHFIRIKIGNDEILKKLLVTLLPQYTGPALTLYRGENEARYHAGKIGFCWTQNIRVAKKFGSGLNACKSNGLLLKAYAPTSAIITGPNEHSRYLGEDEITVNPSLLERIEVIESYPRSH